MERMKSKTSWFLMESDETSCCQLLCITNMIVVLVECVFNSCIKAQKLWSLNFTGSFCDSMAVCNSSSEDSECDNGSTAHIISPMLKLSSLRNA